MLAQLINIILAIRAEAAKIIKLIEKKIIIVNL
jgi:hypothetical protein